MKYLKVFESYKEINDLWSKYYKKLTVIKRNARISFLDNLSLFRDKSDTHSDDDDGRNIVDSDYIVCQFNFTLSFVDFIQLVYEQMEILQENQDNCLFNLIIYIGNFQRCVFDDDDEMKDVIERLRYLPSDKNEKMEFSIRICFYYTEGGRAPTEILKKLKQWEQLMNPTMPRIPEDEQPEIIEDDDDDDDDDVSYEDEFGDYDDEDEEDDYDEDEEDD